MAEVPMTTYLCRWCGAPYAIPTVMGDNPAITKRCALGHKHADGLTPEASLANTKRYLDESEERNNKLHATIRNLKGQVTKLKARRP